MSYQFLFAQGLLWRGKENGGQQVDRVDVGGRVDAGQDSVSEPVDQAAQPFRLPVQFGGGLAPVRVGPGQQFVQEYGLPETQGRYAVAVPQDLEDLE